jgi:hypothetical protein
MSFLDNPRLFLEQHTVQVSEIKNPGIGGKRTFRIAPRMRGSSSYLIDEDDGEGESFEAFWAPYRPNHYSEFDLAGEGYDASVRFILTFTLSGCTFAAGSGRRPKVAHINYQNDREIDQAKIDLKLAKKFGSDPAMTLRKAGYFGRIGPFANKFTVCGVLEHDEWAFYLNATGNFANGLQAWELHGSVDIPAAEQQPDVHTGGPGKSGGRGCCTLI